MTYTAYQLDGSPVGNRRQQLAQLCRDVYLPGGCGGEVIQADFETITQGTPMLVQVVDLVELFGHARALDHEGVLVGTVCAQEAM